MFDIKLIFLIISKRVNLKVGFQDLSDMLKTQLSGLDFTTVFCCNNLNLHRKTSCKDLSFMGIYVLLPNKTNPKRKAFYEQ